LNNSFYNTISSEFNITRQYSWKGWGKLNTYFEKTASIKGKISKDPSPSIKVLDLGCGNGRFLNFLESNFPNIKFDYVGLDSNIELINIAKKATFKNNPIFDLLDCLDLIKLNSYLASRTFDFIVSFGVTHHIPDKSFRLDWFNNLNSFMRSNSYLIYTNWKFLNINKDSEYTLSLDHIRKNKKIITLLQDDYNLDIENLDKDDYLLGWSKKDYTYRYCHHFSDLENTEIVSKLIANNSLVLKERFFSDGRTSNLNEYFIFKKI